MLQIEESETMARNTPSPSVGSIWRDEKRAKREVLVFEISPLELMVRVYLETLGEN